MLGLVSNQVAIKIVDDEGSGEQMQLQEEDGVLHIMNEARVEKMEIDKMQEADGIRTILDNG